MNYRHAYHAGNFADVFKHAALTLLIEALRQKDTPFRYLDTHAGVGVYDLLGGEAGKTREFEGGIARLLDDPDPPPELRAYLDIVRGVNEDGRLEFYPGSPMIVRRLMRSQDRAVLLELHPEDAEALRQVFARDRQVTVLRQDGYTGLKAHLPPKERRGLVLIDPPYEERDEFDRIVRGVQQAHRRFATGILAVWYPIKDRAPVARFHAALAATGIRRVLAVELLLWPDDYPFRLNGSGLVIVNPPWRFDERLRALLPELHKRLDRGTGGGTRVDWLVGE